VEDLKRLNLWDKEMIDDLKYFDGSVQEIGRIPEKLKAKYATAFEIDYEWIIEAASRRQKWIDMGQSLNLYQAKPSGKKISDMYLFAWEKGLKTTYYLRSMGATRIEKSTLDVNRYGNVVGQRQRGEDSRVTTAAQTTPMNTVSFCPEAPGQVRLNTSLGMADCEACQ
jgi:ribonucleoside-diphosphate reductase alpha chain